MLEHSSISYHIKASIELKQSGVGERHHIFKCIPGFTLHSLEWLCKHISMLAKQNGAGLGVGNEKTKIKYCSTLKTIYFILFQYGIADSEQGSGILHSISWHGNSLYLYLYLYSRTGKILL